MSIGGKGDFFVIYIYIRENGGLGVNHTRLDEERTDVAIVIAAEVRKGASIAGRAGDDEELGRPGGQVAKDRVLPMPNERPSAASQHCVTHLVDSGVV